jgi:hypothetical protein
MKVNNASIRAVIDTEITISLTEVEVRALSGIFGYNVDAFLRVFYERMGAAYVRPFEAGVRSLHDTVSKLNPLIAKIDDARKELRQTFATPTA